MFDLTLMELRDKTLEITKGSSKVTLTLSDMGHLLNSDSFKEFLEESQKYHEGWKQE